MYNLKTQFHVLNSLYSTSWFEWCTLALTDRSFEMGYCMNFYLNSHRNSGRGLNFQIYLIKNIWSTWSVRLLRIKLGYPKLATFYYESWYTQRQLVYLAPKDGGEPSKIGHFQNSRSIFKVFYHLNLPVNNIQRILN